MITKERYQITIDKDLADWIKENFYNLSGWLNAIARKEMNTQNTANVYPKSDKKEVNTQVCINPEDEVMRVLEETLYV
jgi:hypothetical protein